MLLFDQIYVPQLFFLQTLQTPSLHLIASVLPLFLLPLLPLSRLLAFLTVLRLNLSLMLLHRLLQPRRRMIIL